MWTYIIRKLFGVPISLLIISLAIFGLSALLTPEERVMAYIKDPLQVRSPMVIENLVQKYRLRDPWPLQYGRWVREVLRGNLGFSTSAQEPVLSALRRRFPATVELVFFSFPLICIGGIILGVVSAIYRNTVIDYLSRIFAISCWSMPSFVVALFILMIFYGWLKVFLPGRLSPWAIDVLQKAQIINFTGFILIDALLNNRMDIFLDALKHMAMPSMTLVLVNWAPIARLTRSAALEIARQDFVTAARARGLPERRVVFGYILRNALIPILTFGGMLAGWLLTGVVITETVFNYDGLGRFGAMVAMGLDFAGILGFALFCGFVIILINIGVDICYTIIDPRIMLD
ncbi:MAG: ABC transporter permease [Candidatus Methanomethylicaceae archaeon]